MKRPRIFAQRKYHVDQVTDVTHPSGAGLERFEISDEVITPEQATPITPAEGMAVPFTRTSAEIIRLECAADRAARTGAPDPCAEGFLLALAWLRQQVPTPNLLMNFDLPEDDNACGSDCQHA